MNTAYKGLITINGHEKRQEFLKKVLGEKPYKEFENILIKEYNSKKHTFEKTRREPPKDYSYDIVTRDGLIDKIKETITEKGGNPDDETKDVKLGPAIQYELETLRDVWNLLKEGKDKEDEIISAEMKELLEKDQNRYEELKKAFNEKENEFNELLKKRKNGEISSQKYDDEYSKIYDKYKDYKLSNGEIFNINTLTPKIIEDFKKIINANEKRIKAVIRSIHKVENLDAVADKQKYKEKEYEPDEPHNKGYNYKNEPRSITSIPYLKIAAAELLKKYKPLLQKASEEDIEEIKINLQEDALKAAHKFRHFNSKIMMKIANQTDGMLKDYAEAENDDKKIQKEIINKYKEINKDPESYTLSAIRDYLCWIVINNSIKGKHHSTEYTKNLMNNPFASFIVGDEHAKWLRSAIKRTKYVDYFTRAMVLRGIIPQEESNSDKWHKEHPNNSTKKRIPNESLSSTQYKIRTEIENKINEGLRAIIDNSTNSKTKNKVNELYKELNNHKDLIPFKESFLSSINVIVPFVKKDADKWGDRLLEFISSILGKNYNKKEAVHIDLPVKQHLSEYVPIDFMKFNVLKDPLNEKKERPNYANFVNGKPYIKYMMEHYPEDKFEYCELHDFDSGLEHKFYYNKVYTIGIENNKAYRKTIALYDRNKNLISDADIMRATYVKRK